MLAILAARTLASIITVSRAIVLSTISLKFSLTSLETFDAFVIVEEVEVAGEKIFSNCN